MSKLILNETDLEKLDAELRAGKLHIVKENLEKFEGHEISRGLLVKIANLPRRAGYQRFALRLLKPIVRAESPVSPPASSEEKIEYAVCLMRMGVVQEAQNILKSIDENKYPECLLYRSFCFFNLWEHHAGIPLLQKYIKSAVSDYQKLVAKTNLLMAYTIQLDYKNGKEIFSDILKEADKNSQKLLVGYSHQLFAELCITKKIKDEAEIHIAKARELLGDENYRYSLHLDQLEAVLNLLSPGEISLGKKKLIAVRKKAAQKKLWEIKRDCDFYECVFTKNEELAQKLYFGTPFKNFHQRLMSLYEKPISFSESYVWFPLKKSENILDIESGTDLPSEKSIRAGGLLHQLLATLASDFYRPFKLQVLFTLLFPNEFYGSGSAHKIYDLIRRLEKWFNENKIPIDIYNDREEYFLKVTAPYGIKVKPFASIQGSQDKFINDLKARFGDKSFSSSEVRTMGLSPSSAKRLLREAVESGQLNVTGGGKYLKYYF